MPIASENQVSHSKQVSRQDAYSQRFCPKIVYNIYIGCLFPYTIVYIQKGRFLTYMYGYLPICMLKWPNMERQHEQARFY